MVATKQRLSEPQQDQHTYPRTDTKADSEKQWKHLHRAMQTGEKVVPCSKQTKHLPPFTNIHDAVEVLGIKFDHGHYSSIHNQNSQQCISPISYLNSVRCTAETAWQVRTDRVG
jgi:hypothetical protein